MSDQQTIYRARMMPVWLENLENKRYFTDEETAKDFLEEYVQHKYGWGPGEWRDDISPSEQRIDMRPVDGHGDARAEVTELPLYSEVPDDVSEVEPTEVDIHDGYV